MKRSALLLLACSCAPVHATLEGDVTAPAIETLRLEMRAQDARVLFRKDAYDTSTFPVTLPDAGPGGTPLHGRIEVKGSSTRLLEKRSVLIKLADGTWRNSARISLNGMGTDGTMMREWLAWNLVHVLGLAAPKVAYTRLSINGADSGLFLWIEWIDPAKFERDGIGSQGQLFHPNDSGYCGDLRRDFRPAEEPCWLKLAPRDDDFGALHELADAIESAPVDGFDRFLAGAFEAQSVIDWIAVNVLISHTDTYNKNYFLWRSDATGRWRVIPWDMDLTFGRSFDAYQPYPRNRINENFQYFYPLELGQLNRLRDKALKNAVLRARLRDRLRELVDGQPDAAHPWRGWFAPERLIAAMARLDRALAPERERDPWMRTQARRTADELDALRYYTWARVAYLARTVFAPTAWERDLAEVQLPEAGRRVAATDGWGYMLATLVPKAGARGARVRAQVRHGLPSLVPPGQDRASCAMRSWRLEASEAATVDLTLEYLEENTLNRELGPAVRDERALVLMALDDGRWFRLPTVTAPVANTLQAPLALPAQRGVELVACLPGAVS